MLVHVSMPRIIRIVDASLISGYDVQKVDISCFVQCIVKSYNIIVLQYLKKVLKHFEIEWYKIYC